MAMLRVHELAQEAGSSSTEIVAFLNGMGSFVKSAASTVSAAEAESVRAAWASGRQGQPAIHRARLSSTTAPTVPLMSETAGTVPSGPWVVKATTTDGRVGYYGESGNGRVGVIDSRGNAYRYRSHNEALGAAYNAKNLRIFADFEIESLPEKPRLKKFGTNREGYG